MYTAKIPTTSLITALFVGCASAGTCWTAAYTGNRVGRTGCNGDMIAQTERTGLCETECIAAEGAHCAVAPMGKNSNHCVTYFYNGKGGCKTENAVGKMRCNSTAAFDGVFDHFSIGCIGQG